MRTMRVAVVLLVVAMTVMFILYSFVGGLVAAAWTDLFQGILIIILSFMLIPLGWQVVGGLEGMKASLEPFRFSLATPSGIGPWVIAMLTVNGLVGIMGAPQCSTASCSTTTAASAATRAPSRARPRTRSRSGTSAPGSSTSRRAPFRKCAGTSRCSVATTATTPRA